MKRAFCLIVLLLAALAFLLMPFISYGQHDLRGLGIANLNAQQAASPVVKITNGIVYYLNFDEASSPWRSVVNNYAFNHGGSGIVSVAGKITNGVFGAASGDWLACNTNKFSTTNLTWSSWIFVTNAASTGRAWSLYDGTEANTVIAVDLTSGGVLRFRLLDVSGSMVVGASVTRGDKFTNAWHFVTVVYDSATLTAYLYTNGVLANSSVLSIAKTNIATAESVYLSNLGASVFQGKMDGSGYWATNLTATQILNMYNSGNGIDWTFNNQ